MCYKCGTVNPKKNDDGRDSIDSSEESSGENILPSRLSPKGMKRGRDGNILDSNSVSSRESYSAIDPCENSLVVISSNPFGDSEEGSSDPYKDPFGERSNNHILDPHVEGSSNTFLLTALDTRGKEIMQLKRKLLRSDNEKADISQRYFRLEKKYEILETELKGKVKGGKTKKKKNFLQRVASAVGCQSVNKGEIYIPK